ncbi:kidins220b [Symbiodinium sp. CCMP2592]|nr:kidins220b [Symbiodinium sp. CCMP2592]
MAQLAELAGAVFEGHLQAPGLGKCGLSYRFGSLQSGLHTAVKSQRRQLGWTNNEEEIRCISAICCIPDLGLESEEVMVSVNPAREDGSRLMLLQSLSRPDLGLTILLLNSGASSLAGGDESWTPDMVPIVRAERCKAPEKAKPVPRPPAASQTSPTRRPMRQARIPEPDAEPTPSGDSDPSHHHLQDPTSPSAPAVWLHEDQPRGFGVVGGSGLLDTEAVSICMPVPFGEEAGGAGRPVEAAPRKAHENGIGRSVADAETNSSGPRAVGYHSSESAAPRPDIATGKPGPLDHEFLGSNDENAEAANQERFVAAARAGEVGDLQQLFSRSGVRVDGCVSEGRFADQTALVAAASRGRADVVRILLDRKAAVDASDANGWTGLMHAIHGQRAEVARYLLQARADVRQVADKSGSTPLILAASGARHELCKILIEHRSPLEISDMEGSTALHHAARRGNGAAVMTLLAARAKLEKQDAQGRTPLLAAAVAGRANTVQLLVGQGANVKAADCTGKGAKELATAYQHARVVQQLDAITATAK